MPLPKKGERVPGSGIKKGQKHKKTQRWEQFGEKIIEGNLDKIEAYINTLPPEQQFESMLKLLEYFKPKLSRTDIQAEVNATSTVQVLRKELSELPDINI